MSVLALVPIHRWDYRQRVFVYDHVLPINRRFLIVSCVTEAPSGCSCFRPRWIFVIRDYFRILLRSRRIVSFKQEHT